MFMKGWEIIQNCELAHFSMHFNKARFQNAITEMNEDQFNQFCKEYLDLRHFYDLQKNAWATDEEDIVKQFPPDTFWPLMADFDTL